MLIHFYYTPSNLCIEFHCVTTTQLIFPLSACSEHFSICLTVHRSTKLSLALWTECLCPPKNSSAEVLVPRVMLFGGGALGGG